MSTLPLTELSVKSFLDQLGSDQPTPGGGAAAALAGALAAGLGRMVCALTVDKPKFAEAAEQVRQHASRLTRAAAMLQQLVDEDAAAYAELHAAFQIDRADPERAGRIEAAARLAAAVPLETLAICNQVRLDLHHLEEIGNPNLRADMTAGLHLAAGAMLAAGANVRANLPFLAADERTRIESELAELLPE